MNALHVRLVPDNPRLAPVPARSNRAVISTSMLHANDQIWHQMRTEPYGLTEHLVLLEFRIGPRSCVETAQGRETRQHAETRQHEERLTRLELWQTTDTTAGPSGRPGTTGLPSAVTDESMGVCRTILQPFVVDTRCPRNLPGPARAAYDHSSHKRRGQTAGIRRAPEKCVLPARLLIEPGHLGSTVDSNL